MWTHHKWLQRSVGQRFSQLSELHRSCIIKKSFKKTFYFYIPSIPNHGPRPLHCLIPFPNLAILNSSGPSSSDPGDTGFIQYLQRRTSLTHPVTPKFLFLDRHVNSAINCAHALRTLISLMMQD